MNNENDTISRKKLLDNLYLDIYKDRKEKLSLEIKTNNLVKEMNNLNVEKIKIKRKEISMISIKRFHSLIICLVTISYLWFFVEKLQVLAHLQKAIYIASAYIGVLTIGLLGIILFSKIENKMKNKISKKQKELSKQIEAKTKEISLNRERIKELDIEIEDILRKITEYEKAGISKEHKEESKDNYVKEDITTDYQEKVYTRKRNL